jgi:MFS transporter, DHA1 family, tetracycline resistance protein
MATATAAPAPRSALLIVFLVVVIDLLGFGIVLPLLPVFAKTYVAALFPGGHVSGAGGAVIGLLMASFSAMQFFFAPVWGRASDRAGRRPILLVGLGGSVVFYLLFGYACGLPAESAALALMLLFLARIGAGIAGATIATAQAVIADCTPPEGRKHGMALIGFAFGVGFTVGPVVGFAALLWFPGHHGAIGYTAAGLSALALALGAAILPETRDFAAAPPLERRWFDPRAAGAALANPAIAPVILTFFLATLGFASFEVTLSLLNEEVLQLPKTEAAQGEKAPATAGEGPPRRPGEEAANPKNFLIFAYVGFVLMLTQGFLYRRVARALNEPTLMTIGITLMGLGVLSLAGVTYAAVHRLLTFWGLLPAQLAALTLAVIGFAFLTPSAQALISRRSDPARQGEVLGVNQSAAALARILGPVLGVTLYFSTRDHLLPYVLGAALVLVMLPVIPVIRRGGDESRPAPVA